MCTRSLYVHTKVALRMVDERLSCAHGNFNCCLRHPRCVNLIIQGYLRICSVGNSRSLRSTSYPRSFLIPLKLSIPSFPSSTYRLFLHLIYSLSLSLAHIILISILQLLLLLLLLLFLPMYSSHSTMYYLPHTVTMASSF